MRRVPEPEHTPAGPAFEGRLLDRADEEVVDQGAPFDIRTLVTRRSVLSLVGIGVGAVALAACAPRATGAAPSSAAPTPSLSGSTGAPSAAASPAVALPAGEIPDETAGPFPGDGSNGPDILERSGVVRRDIRTSIGGGAAAEGVPLQLSLMILDTANGDVPFAGAAVYIWQCDAEGRYSMYSEGVENETYLRGVQVADSNGVVTFDSIYPACYTGRWPHIHFEVYPDLDSITDAGSAVSTSQVALPESVSDVVYALPAYSGSARRLSQISLESDMVFSDDLAALQMANVTGDATSGYVATLPVRVDTSTAQASVQRFG